MPDSRRLFVGLVVPDENAERLTRRTHPTLLEDDGSTPTGLRLYAPADLHMTLVYLGEVSEARRVRLQGALQEELRGLNAPELVLSGTGSFPSQEHPRVLWAGVEERSEVTGRLDALRNRAMQACLSVGWRPAMAELERPFRPHVTLGRVAKGGPEVHRAFFDLDFDQSWLPVEVSLIESRPAQPDERYRVIWAVPLVVRPG